MQRVKVKVSPKYQVVIPKSVREELKIQPGQELLVYVFEGKVHLDPPRSIKELRGMAKGIRWEPTDRDPNDRY
ncbi:MAG: AbrB/MazE/SpoVT family DNA-binding domain-containing protein [Candidatus Acidiferrales bacterium]